MSIVVDDGCILLGRIDIKGHDQKKRVYSIEGLCPTPSGLGVGGNTEPKIAIPIDFIVKGSDKLTTINEVFEGKPFNYVSLFSGIGGFEQALNKLGGTCVMASEIDKYANQAYEVLYGHPTVGDVTKIDASAVPDHDLLVGGFPCQAFSVAGKRLGFDDTRGTLFFEIARIAAEKKPKAMLLENVKGLVGHDGGRTLDTIVQTLCDIGYTVDFEVLNSKYFGVPQNRERIFIVAIRDDLIEVSPWVIGKRTDVVAKGKRRISALASVKTFNFDYPEQSEVTTILRDVLEENVDERYYLAEDKTRKLIAQLSYDIISKMVEEHEKDGEDSDPKETDDNPQLLGHIDLNGHDAIKRVYSAEGVSPTLTTMGGGHREPKIAEVQPRLNIVGHSGSGGQKGHIYATDGLMSCLTATDYKQPKQIVDEVRPVLTPDRLEKRQNGRRFKDNGEPSFTLTAQDRHGDAVSETNPPRYRIRKLTPLECFRLQGFSDDAHQALVDAGISNSQRYKMAGNAVTVTVISAIGKRLLPYLEVKSGVK